MKKILISGVLLISLAIVFTVLFYRCGKETDGLPSNNCNGTAMSVVYFKTTFSNPNGYVSNFPNFAQIASSGFSNFVTSAAQLETNGSVYVVMTVHMLDLADASNYNWSVVVDPTQTDMSCFQSITSDGYLYFKVSLPNPPYAYGTTDAFEIYIDNVDITAVDNSGNAYEWQNDVNDPTKQFDCYNSAGEFVTIPNVLLTSKAISSGREDLPVIGVYEDARYGGSYTPLHVQPCYGFLSTTFYTTPITIDASQLVPVTNDPELLKIKAARSKKVG